MHRTRSYLPILFFCFLLGSCVLVADTIPNKSLAAEQRPAVNPSPRMMGGADRGAVHCSCGCPCSFECGCGCTKGNPCRCWNNQAAPATAPESQPEESYAPCGGCYYQDGYNEGCACGEGCHCCSRFAFGKSYIEIMEEYYSDGIQPDPLHPVYELECCRCLQNIWLPFDDPPLFRPFMASPRQVAYSAGWRFNDNVLVKNVIPVSYGDSIPLYRRLYVWPWCGQLQIDLEGALWAVFDPLHDSSPLIDADYYVGIPITYAIDRWSFRLCGYHISTHIGDEFLLNHPGFHRRNPSAEFLDFFASWDITDDIRLYGGIGWVVAQDDSFKLGHIYGGAGMEVRLFELSWVDYCNQIYGVPIFGMDFKAQSRQDKHINQTYILGYEFGKLIGNQRRLRFFMEYHDGYSVDGQFQKRTTNYFALRVTWGY